MKPAHDNVTQRDILSEDRGAAAISPDLRYAVYNRVSLGLWWRGVFRGVPVYERRPSPQGRSWNLYQKGRGAKRREKPHRPISSASISKGPGGGFQRTGHRASFDYSLCPINRNLLEGPLLPRPKASDASRRPK